MTFEYDFNQLLALYGDTIFPQLATIVARYLTPQSDNILMNTRHASVRQSIEHLFGSQKNAFKLCAAAHRFQMFLHGVKVSRMIFNSFFLFNCYTCMNESPNNHIL